MKQHVPQILYLLIGNIGSGKTTCARNLLRLKNNCVSISKDWFRKMIGCGQYVFDLKIELIINDLEQTAIEMFIDNGKNIIIDDDGLCIRLVRTRLLTDDVIRCLHNDGMLKIVSIIMPRLSMEQCVNNRIKDPHDDRKREEWENIWKKFDKIYSEPDFSEVDEIIRIKDIDSCEQKVNCAHCPRCHSGNIAHISSEEAARTSYELKCLDCNNRFYFLQSEQKKGL